MRTADYGLRARLSCLLLCLGLFAGIEAGGQDLLSFPPGGLELADYDSFLILLTGRDGGLLEQSDCHPEQLGGLEPRADLIRRLRATGLPTLTVDLGDSFDRPAPHTEPAAATILRALDLLSYDAMVLAERELTAVSPAFLADMAGKVRFSFLSANLSRDDGEPVFWKPWIKLQVGALRLGVIGLTPESVVLEATAPYRIAPRAGALVRLLPEVLAEVDRVVVATNDLGRMVASDFPQVDLWLSHDPRTPFRYATRKTFVFYSLGGEEFLGAFIARYSRLGERPLAIPYSYPLLVRKHPHPGTRGMITTLYRDLLARGLAPRVAGPLADQPFEQHSRADYVGSASCQSCHAETFAHWQATPHAASVRTLAGKQRDFWPECLACHSTGWGAASGYRIAEPTAPRTLQAGAGAEHSHLEGLAAVGCETCHGPGSRHVVAPARENIRNDVSPLTPEVCQACHTREHDPGFEKDLLTRFADILHPPSRPPER